jgi:hypothetical protein
MRGQLAAVAGVIELGAEYDDPMQNMSKAGVRHGAGSVVSSAVLSTGAVMTVAFVGSKLDIYTNKGPTGGLLQVVVQQVSEAKVAQGAAQVGLVVVEVTVDTAAAQVEVGAMTTVFTATGSATDSAGGAPSSEVGSYVATLTFNSTPNKSVLVSGFDVWS